MRRRSRFGSSDGRFGDFLQAKLDVLRAEIEVEVAKQGNDRLAFRSNADGFRSNADAYRSADAFRSTSNLFHSELPPEGDHHMPFGDRLTVPVTTARRAPSVVQLGESEPPISEATSFQRSISPSPKAKQFGVLKSFRSSISSTDDVVLEQSEDDKVVARKTALYAGGIANGDHNMLKSVLKTVLSSKSQTSEASRCSVAGYVDKWGEWFLTAITIANAITIGVSVDNSPSSMTWTIVETVFAFAYLTHMIMMISFLGVRQYFLGGTLQWKAWLNSDLRWRWFEFILVLAQLFEVAISVLDVSEAPLTGAFRLLRLTRVARLLRFAKLKIFSELSMMIHGAIGGMRTLVWGTVMISLPLYVVALFMQQALNAQADTDSAAGVELFATLPMAAFTIFRCSIAGDCSTEDGKPLFLLITQQHGFSYAVLYCVINVFMMCGIFNVIAAIFVENMLEAAKRNSISEKRARLVDTQMFAGKVSDLMHYIIEQHDATFWPDKPAEGELANATTKIFGDIDLKHAMSIRITPRFMSDLCKKQRFTSIMRELDIADEDLIDMFDTLDVDGNGAIDLEELVIGLRKLRGQARKSDIVEVALIVRSNQLQMQEVMEQMTSSFLDMQCRLDALRNSVPSVPESKGRVA